MELYIDKYIDRVVANTCFQKLINRELSFSRHSDINEKISDILMTNVQEFKKVMQEGKSDGSFDENADFDLCIATVFGTKNYIINNPSVASRLFGKNVLDETFLENELKPRIKTYLKRLLKSYLVINNES